MFKQKINIIVSPKTKFRRILGFAAILFATFFLYVGSASAATPVIDEITNEQQITQGNIYTFTPTLSDGEDVRWRKEYGPDDMTVNSSTGAISWAIPANLPGEAFHIGVKACNSDGCDTEVWVLVVGSGNVIYVGPSETYTTISAGTAAASGGDTIIIRNRPEPYTGAENQMINYGSSRGSIPPSGTATGYTTLIAEDPGRVLLDGENERAMIRMSGNYADRSGQAHGSYDASYIAIKGIVCGNSNYTGSILTSHAQHIKLIDCGAFNGPDVGAPIAIMRSNDILVEGCYVWGEGRKAIVSYYSDNVIMRRCVARMDIQDVDGEPISLFEFYVSHNGRAQNCVAIDTDQYQYMTGYSTAAGAFVDACGSACYNASHQNNIFTHSLALNIYNKVTASQADEGPPENASDPATFQNIVAWDMKAIGSNGPSPSYYGPNLLSRDDTVFDQCTFGEWSSPLGSLYSGAAINGWQNSDSMTNSIIYDLNDNDGSPAGVFYGYETVDHNNIFSDEVGTINVSTSNVTDTLDYDPTANGLEYIVRREPGSQLETDDVGADLTFMKGKSGTMFGESGFDDETTVSMWPFPHEDIIREHMHDYSYSGVHGNVTGARGFTTYISPHGSPNTLTSYIWEYLGNEIPCEIYDTCSAPPAADFIASTQTVSQGGAVTFTDASSNSPTSWSWTFDSGAPASSNEQNPTVTYNAIGTYTVTLLATNAYGSDTETKTGYIIVAAPDTTSPTAPSNLQATSISSSQIDLTWNISTDNVAVTEYRIYRDSDTTSIGTVSDCTDSPCTYSDTGLEAQTEYSYIVRAYDAADNESGNSNQASATTQAAPTDNSGSSGYSGGSSGCFINSLLVHP